MVRKAVAAATTFGLGADIAGGANIAVSLLKEISKYNVPAARERGS